MDQTDFKIVLDKEEHKTKVAELRALVADHATDPERQLSDVFLARWLVIKEWDVEKAADMFKKSMEWRKEANPDKVFETFPIEKKEIWNHLHNVYWPGKIVGTTKDGWLVYCESLGRLDPAGLITKLDQETRVAYQIWKLEENEAKRREIEKEHGGSVTAGTFVIMDLTGLNWSHFSSVALSYFKEVTQISKQNYPETLRKLYIINTPGLFTMMWKIVTPMLDASTLKKTRILGSDYLSVLSADVDINIIPSNLGGQGPALPKGGTYYNPGEVQEGDAEKDEWEHETVPRSGVLEKVVEVTEKNTIILWEFSTEDNDVGFGVFYEKDGEKIEELPVKRYESNLEVIRDLLVANKIGKYILTWDNTFSWTKRKFLRYHYNVLPLSSLQAK